MKLSPDEQAMLDGRHGKAKQKAMDLLETLADQGSGVLLPDTLINDPRYRGIVGRLRDNLNGERAALGLEPIGK